MANKMYYNLEEATAKLGCTEDQLRGMVRAGRLREFRDAGKVHYRVDDVDRLASVSGDNVQLEGSGELTLSVEDSHDLPAAKGDSGAGRKGKSSDSNAPVDLGGSDSGLLSLSGSGSGELQLEDSDTAAPPAKPGKAAAKAKESSGTGDALSLEEVDKEAVDGMKKDDTVITNIGISVFDDEDLEIAVDPMAKTVVAAGGDEHIALDGSGAGSGLLDLTRESDDTSLGAELLEGIDMGDTAETVVPAETVVEGGGAEAGAESAGLPDISAEAGPTTGTGVVQVGTVEAASPAFTGLLAAAAIVLVLVAAMAIATSMNAWPGYLDTLAGQFWFFLIGTLATGGVFAGVGYLVGRQATAGPKPAKPKKEKKAKKGKKGKGKEEEAEPSSEGEQVDMDEIKPLE
ncbi:MAG: helix-turn-helix domain-containing protein [Phycisphaerae bacterium]|nr:helix-turn-helix domain-containing protein [Phycisphaerae bacterium]